MLARCLANSLAPTSSDPDLIRFLTDGRSDVPKFPLIGGEDYLVVAVGLGPHTPWFFVHDRFNGSRLPIEAPCSLFSVLDARPPRLWVLGRGQDRLDHEHAILAPSFWATDPLFHGKMFEGETVALQQMEAATREMLLEFPLSWVQRKAVLVGNGNWVSDEECDDTWQAEPREAMTLSPKTGRLFHNPLFGASR